MKTNILLSMAKGIASGARPTSRKSHNLRVMCPSEGAYVEVHTDTVNLGRENNARRVTKTTAALFRLGCRVLVETSRGWEDRKVILGSDGAYYLRLPSECSTMALDF